MRLDPIILIPHGHACPCSNSKECICYANGLEVIQTTVPRCAQSRINAETRLYEFVVVEPCVQPQQQVMPDDHSKVVPLLPIPNRTVKRLSADDSADSRVKVGHRQATIPQPAPDSNESGAFWLRKPAL